MDDTNADMGWHLSGRTIAKYPTAAAWRAATRSMLATVGPGPDLGRLPRGPEPRPRRGPPTTTRRRRGATGSSSPRAPRRSTTRSGARRSSGWFAGNDWTYRQQFQALTEQAGKIFLGITYAPHGRHALDGLGARELPALRRAGQRRRAGLRVRATPRRRIRTRRAGRLTSARRVGARFQVGSAWRRNFTGGTVLVNPTGVHGHRPARAVIRARRWILDNVGHAGPDERRDPALLVRRGRSAAARADAAAPSRRVARRFGQRNEGRAPLDRSRRLAGRHLPQRRPQGDRGQHRLVRRRPRAQAEGDLLVQGLRGRHLDVH